MHSIAIAEWILALVMPRERATSIAGDLAETPRGPARFWSAVVRTAFAAIIHEMTAAPRQMIAMTAYSVLLSLTFAVCFDVVLSLGRRIPGTGWMGPFLGVGFLLLMPVIVGRMVARQSEGKELAAWTSIAIFACACWIAWGFAPKSFLADIGFLVVALPSPLHLTGMLIGMMSHRVRKLL
jgi:hypothetical protein